MNKQILNFLKALRESADLQYKIFTEGSCYRLYMILKTVFPTAKPYWSDRSGHCITQIDGEFYDIGGRVTKQHVEDMGYYKVPKNQEHGYSLMKWLGHEKNHSVATEKYKDQ